MIGASSQSSHGQQTLNTQHHQHQHLVNHRTSSNQQHNDDDDYQDDHGVRVGANYQAEIPQFIAYSPAPEYYEDEKAIKIWSPYNKIPDHVLDEFITKAKDKFFYNAEQALGMLSWHKYDLNRSYADLPNFVPFPSEWSVEDKVLFEQAYQFHEKQFNKIKQMLPEKTMANLINYYYSWKKTRTRASLMERQTRRFASRKIADSNGASDEEEADDENDVDNNLDSGNAENMDVGDDQGENSDYDGGAEDPTIKCAICKIVMRENGETQHIIVDGIIDYFCTKCYVEWKASGKRIKRLKELGDCFYHPMDEPKRILFSYADVLELVEGNPDAGDMLLKLLDSQVQDAKRDIQTKKQTLSLINEKIQPIADQIADLNMNEFSDILPEYKHAKVWTNDEVQMAIQGFRRYGLDYTAISDVIRTKSPEAVKIFFVSQKDRLGLELLVQQHQKHLEAANLPNNTSLQQRNVKVNEKSADWLTDGAS